MKRPSPPHPGGFPLLLAVLLGMGTLSCATARAAKREEPPPDARRGAKAAFTLTPESLGHPQPVPKDFLGLMLPLQSVTQVVGASGTNLNPAFLNLLGRLESHANGPITLRIGNDRLAWTASRIGALRGLAQTRSVRFVLGVRFDDQGAVADMEALAAALPADAILAFEPGNEPDLYKGIPDWGYQADMRRFDAWVKASARAKVAGTLGTRFAAPVWSGVRPEYGKHLDGFIAEHAGHLSMVDMHHYAGSNFNPAKAQASGFLLTEKAVLDGPRQYAGHIRTAHDHRLPFAMYEWNSASCGGIPGVSDAFESALWTVDGLFEWRKAGLDRLALTTGDNTGGFVYSPYGFTVAGKPDGTNAYALANVAPCYYGLLMFMQATQRSAGVVAMEADAGNKANVKCWATVDVKGVIRVVVVNKDPKFRGSVEVAVPAEGLAQGPATAFRLEAPGFAAKEGVRYAGQTYDGSRDGKPLGELRTESIAAHRKGRYRVPFDSVGAVLLEFPAARGG